MLLFQTDVGKLSVLWVIAKENVHDHIFAVEVTLFIAFQKPWDLRVWPLDMIFLISWGSWLSSEVVLIYNSFLLFSWPVF